MLPQNIFRLLVYLAVAAYLSSANADPTEESKAEAALAGNALSVLGIRHIDTPCTPYRVWRAIANAGACVRSRATAEIARQADGTWLWVIDQPSIA